MKRRTSYYYRKNTASHQFFWLGVGAMTLLTLAVLFFLLSQEGMV